MKKNMEKKISDYKRFITTLLILSSYLYVGTLISLFEYHTKLYIFLYPIIAFSLLTALVMTIMVKKWTQTMLEQ